MKKVTKPIIMSALSALAFGSLGVAGTFALFTDKAETVVQAEAGIVDVDTTAGDLVFTELGGTAAVDSQGTLVNSIGGTAKLVGNELILTHWAPGDKVVLKLTNTNKSNVDIQTRFTVAHTFDSTNNGKDLYPALRITYSGKDAGNNPIPQSTFMQWQEVQAAAPANLANGEIINEITATIEFVNHDDFITERETGVNNAFQDANCRIIFSQEAVQANAAVTNVLPLMNAKLTEEATNDGAKNPTLYDAIVDLKSENAGWDADFLKQNEFYWDSTDDELVYRDSIPAGEEYKYFRVYDAMPAVEDGFSVYASSSWNVANVELKGFGFDAGEASGIQTVTYVGEANARNNIIRTNSANTSIVVNAPLDTVNHYGTAGSLTINGIAQSSYHEFGKIAFATIAKGRIVLESTSDISRIHINKKTDHAFDTVVIADNGGNLPGKITRDQVDVQTEKELVVKVQVLATSVEENVYVYPYTDTSTDTETGTTAKVTSGVKPQNENVETPLGVLVLDNSANDGEKAMSKDDISVEKAAVVEEAVNYEEAAADPDIIVHHENYLAPTCVAEGHSAYDWWLDGDNQEQRSGYYVYPIDPNAHGTLIYEQDGDAGHHQHCTRCGHDFPIHLHEYTEQSTVCSVCEYNSVTTVVVSAPGSELSGVSLEKAIEDYNAQTGPGEKDYVITLQEGVYTVEPNKLAIMQGKTKVGKTLTIKGTDKSKVIIKPDLTKINFTQKAAGGTYGDLYFGWDSQYLFGIDGNSDTGEHGAVSFSDLTWDYRDVATLSETENYSSIRLNALFCMSGNNNRYAHDITIDNCNFFGPGGKMLCAISSNQGNSQPSGIHIKNCYGDKLNAWANVYLSNYRADAMSIENCRGDNFLVAFNVVNGEGSVRMENVIGSYMYVNNSERWACKIMQGSLSLVNTEWILIGTKKGADGTNLNAFVCVSSTSDNRTISISNSRFERNDEAMACVRSRDYQLTVNNTQYAANTAIGTFENNVCQYGTFNSSLVTTAVVTPPTTLSN